MVIFRTINNYGDLQLTQKAIFELYNIHRTVLTKHLKNIFNDYELDKSMCNLCTYCQRQQNV